MAERLKNNELDELFPGRDMQPVLKYARLAPDVWSALGRLKRTGYVKRDIPNPETVQEHTIAVMRIAETLGGGAIR